MKKTTMEKYFFKRSGLTIKEILDRYYKLLHSIDDKVNIDIKLDTFGDIILKIDESFHRVMDNIKRVGLEWTIEDILIEFERRFKIINNRYSFD